MTAITVDGLTKSYGDLVAVDDVSLRINEGETFVVLGPNGAGKTTTIEICEGLCSADKGNVTVLGSAPGARSTAGRIGVMPQQGDLYAGIRAEEALKLFASFYDEREDVGGLIEQLDLGGVRRTTWRHLSGGEKRRLSLAIALVGKPKLVFLDEPTAEMDIEGRAKTWEFVRTLKARGTTVVLTTHLLDEAERVADRVAVMRRGRVVASGTVAELTATDTPQITITVDGAIDTASLGSHLGATVTAFEDSYAISGAAIDPAAIARLTAWLDVNKILVRSMRVGARSLEEAYVELTR